MASQATTRIQFLDYELIRSGRFNPNELALLNILVTYSDHCEVKQEFLARAMNRSVSTIRRTMNSLIKKGIIERSYTLFKRCYIRIVPLAIQKMLRTASGIIRQSLIVAKKARKKLIKSTVRSSLNHADRSNVIEPTRSETKEIKHINRDINLKQKIELKPKSFDLNKAKDEAIARFKASFCN